MLQIRIGRFFCCHYIRTYFSLSRSPDPHHSTRSDWNMLCFTWSDQNTLCFTCSDPDPHLLNYFSIWSDPNSYFAKRFGVGGRFFFFKMIGSGSKYKGRSRTQILVSLKKTFRVRILKKNCRIRDTSSSG